LKFVVLVCEENENAEGLGPSKTPDLVNSLVSTEAVQLSFHWKKPKSACMTLHPIGPHALLSDEPGPIS